MSNETKTKTKYYSRNTVDQLATEFVVMANSSGRPILLDISGDRHTTSTSSHLLKRADILEGSSPQQTWSTSRPLDNLMSRLPHIRSIVYKPDEPELLVDQWGGMFNLNTYRKPNCFDAWAELQPNQNTCPAIFDNYMKRMFPNADERKFVIRWMARNVMQPGYRMRVALLMRGQQGTGKGVFVDHIMSELVGKPNLLNTKLSEITGNFNVGIARCTVCCLDETYCQKKSSADKVKKYITDDYVTVTEKHKDSVQQHIYASIVILSNDEHPLFIEEGDRRYYVPEYIAHKHDKHETAAFMGAFLDWFYKEGGIAELYCSLMHVDAVNAANNDGFAVAIETASHEDIKSTNTLDDRTGALVDFLDGVNQISLAEIAKLDFKLPQPAITKTLKQQGFVNKTINVNGTRCRKWVRPSLQRKSVTRLPSSTNDPDYSAGINFNLMQGAE